MSGDLSQSLKKFIATRDKRIAKKQPWSPAPLLEAFSRLVEKGSVIVGGRASCGTTDPTWIIYRSWCEVIKKARNLGYEIHELPIKQNNSWATKSGGFWQESEYRLIAMPATI